MAQKLYFKLYCNIDFYFKKNSFYTRETISGLRISPLLAEIPSLFHDLL
jgi:hypothetical protein